MVIEFSNRPMTLRESVLVQKYRRNLTDLDAVLELLLARAVPGTPREAIENLTVEDLPAVMEAMGKGFAVADALAKQVRDDVVRKMLGGEEKA